METMNSIEELQSEYKILYEKYQELRSNSEEDTQKIYELKRHLETANASNNYLQQELEQLTQAPTTTNNSHLPVELEELRKKYADLNEFYRTLQQEHDAITEENVVLRQKLDEKCNDDKLKVLNKTDDLENELSARLSAVERENLDLLQKLEEYVDSSIKYTMIIADRDKNIEILQEQLTCLEENLRFKRDELEEKTQLLESTQEQICDANARIAMLTSTPDNNDRKGNSLFAEVDDQRQAMKHLLTAQKKSYMQMKKIFSESQFEIRRLKRENIAMHTELQTCSSIFCNADKTYHDKLNERIQSLLRQNDELEEKLDWTQDKLKDLAGEKGIVWLESMLKLCKKETDDLKKELHSVRIQKGALEEQYRISQQDMARWRFESLKTRCVLMDRENLLNENNIKFKVKEALEFHISEKEQEDARPRIFSLQSRASLDASFKMAEAKIEEMNLSKQIAEEKEISINESINLEKNMNNDSINETPTDDINIEDNKENIETETTINTPNEIQQTMKIDDIEKSLETSLELTEVIPIETTSFKKKRNAFTEVKKNVNFSTAEDIIHNYTPMKDSTQMQMKTNAENKMITQQLRTKSNIIVRRITVASKQDK